MTLGVPLIIRKLLLIEFEAFGMTLILISLPIQQRTYGFPHRRALPATLFGYDDAPQQRVFMPSPLYFHGSCCADRCRAGGQRG